MITHTVTVSHHRFNNIVINILNSSDVYRNCFEKPRGDKGGYIPDIPLYLGNIENLDISP